MKYAVTHLKIKFRRFFPKYEKNTVLYKMSNGEFSFFSKNVREFVFNGEVLVQYGKEIEIKAMPEKTLKVEILDRKLIISG